MKLINEWTPADFSHSIQSLGLISSNQNVEQVSSAGEGNMNYTYRLSLNNGTSLIAKQSPPYCAKYPQIPAPEERIFAEKSYYELVASDPKLSAYSPKILGFDPAQHLLFLEDLGQASDLEKIYRFEPLSGSQCKALVSYLSCLHRFPKKKHNLPNHSMRKLNHDYIFTLPFEQSVNTIDLEQITPGLTSVIKKVKADSKLKEVSQKLGQIYLNDQRELVHGDYYPRSWVETPRGLFVIDPEFGHFGRKEFDLGVFLAHLMMSGSFAAGLHGLENDYADFEKVDSTLLTRFTAVEVLRRLLFVAQVPVKNELTFKTKLIEASHQALLSGHLNDLKKAF